MYVDTGACGGNRILEGWVRQMCQQSGQRVDWHNRGLAQVLYLGDYNKIVESIIRFVPCPANITVTHWCDQDGKTVA